MANFRLIQGMFVECIESIGGLEKGKQYQVLLPRFGGYIGFIGVDYQLPQKLSGKYIAPIGFKEKTNDDQKQEATFANVAKPPSALHTIVQWILKAFR